MTPRAIRSLLGLILSFVLVSTLAASPALGAKNEKKKNKQQDAQAALVIETVRGLKFRMADTKMAERVTRIGDPEGDQRTNEGDPAPDAPRHTDIVNVYVAQADMPTKLLRKMDKDWPEGTAGSFYGPVAEWDTGDAAVFVAAEMARKRPAGAPGQQLQIGIDGADGAPMQVDAWSDDVAGLSTFTLSGLFNNGAWASGATDVSDHAPGDEFEWYDAESGAFGFYDNRRKTWYAVVPRPRDARRITVAVRSSTDAGEVVDRLEQPGGGHFIDLRAPTGGLDVKGTLEPLSCRALETYSGSSTDPSPSDPAATLIRYTAGMAPGADADATSELMSSARAAVGSVPMLLTPIGSEDEPMEVDGVLEEVRGIDAVTLTIEVPEGQWAFEPAEGAQIELPNGEALIDHRTLTGRTGVRTGAGLDGVVAGDPSCGWDALDLATEDLAEAEVDAETADAAPADEEADA